MAERVRTRDPEPKQVDGAGYWMGQRRSKRIRERAANGKIVVTSTDREWGLGTMGRNYRFIYEGLFDDTALQNWWIFMQDVKVHSGSHRHQGGLIIYVLEGSGYSIVEGERCEWEAGDLLLLPIVQNGVEHQHFNNDPNVNARWVAFIYLPFWDGVCAQSILSKNSPLWDAAGKPSAVGLSESPELPAGRGGAQEGGSFGPFTPTRRRPG
jgi:hypothetical protein